MEPKLFYYLNLALCGVVFLELLYSFRKNPTLKTYFLLIIASLFVMNLFCITGVATRVDILVVKTARTIYACFTVLAIIQVVNQKTPWWTIALAIFTFLFITGLRLAYFQQIDIESLSRSQNQIFSIGPELYTPVPVARYIILAMALTGIVIAWYFYRRMLLRMNWESSYYKPLTRWIILFVAPFFLLSIFGFLGNLKLITDRLSSYFFAFFSCTILCSFFLRPKFLDAGSKQLNEEEKKQPSYDV